MRVRCPRERGSADGGVNVVVLTKWVPEPEGTPTLGEDGLLVREGADGALDPGDEYGLEAALQLVEAAGDGEITLLTMGPEVAHAALQRGLAMGAHKGLRITDDSLRGADALVTARVLAAAVGRQTFDLVIGGEINIGYGRHDQHEVRREVMPSDLRFAAYRSGGTGASSPKKRSCLPWRGRSIGALLIFASRR